MFNYTKRQWNWIAGGLFLASFIINLTGLTQWSHLIPAGILTLMGWGILIYLWIKK